jgi:twinkle protein
MGMWATLSVPNGASKGSQKLEYLDNCSDWVESIDEFVIATDGDEAGVILRDELIRRLGVEKCRYVIYPSDNVVPKDGSFRKCKDLNEVLVYLGSETLRQTILNSQSIPVDGIYYLEDIFQSMLDNFRKGIQLAPSTRFPIIDDFFRWKKGDINLFSGYANYGKTTFLMQLMLIKSMYDGWKWAIFSPENYPANDFYDDIVEMYTGKWLTKMTEEEYTIACDFINKHFFYVYPDNEHDINSIHEKFRYLVLKKGIDGVMIDPFNQLDKSQKPYERDDQYLSEVLKEIKRFALLNAVCYNIVTHPKNPIYEKGKALPPVGMYDLAGGAMWGNKSDQIIIYHRPLFHNDKNSPEVEIHVIKTKRKRTGGQNGEFQLRMLWSQKRFCDPITNDIPCDISRINKTKFQENNGLLLNLPTLTDDIPF